MSWFRFRTGRRLQNALPLALVLGTVGLGVAASSLYLAYRAELTDDQEWVEGIARSEEATIEALLATHGGFPMEGPLHAESNPALGALTEAYREANTWGESVALHLVALEADTLSPLLVHSGPGEAPRGPDRHSPEFERVLRRALDGESGSAWLPERGGGFLVVFRPISAPGGRILALATTMDLAEIREPFIRLGLFIGSATLLLVLIGSLITGGIARPTLRALEESEDRYRKLFQDSGEAMLITSVGGIVQECNEAASLLLGSPKEAIVGRSVLGFYQDPARREELLRTLESDGRVRGMELHLRRESGEDFVCLANIYRRTGTPEGGALLETVLTDITEQKARETALEASEARYFEMFEHAPDMLLSVDPGTGLIRECNDTLVRKLGFPREEILGRAALDFCEPESLGQAQELQELLLGTGSAEGIELVLRRKNGSALAVGANGLGVRDDTGQVVATRLSLRDLTEQRQLMDRLDRVLNGTRDGFWEWPDIGREELWWSPGFFELLGYKPGAFQPTLSIFNEMIHPQDREQVAGQTQKLLEGGGSFQNEYRIRRKDGSTAWFQAKGFVYLDAHIGSARMSGSVRDVTEQKKAEKALRESEAFLKHVVGGAQEGILALNRDLEYTLWNSFMEGHSGLRAEEVLGRSCRELFPFLEEVGALSAMRRALTGETVEIPPHEFPHTPSGHLIWVSDMFSPLKNAEGEVIGVLGIVRDVTALKNAGEKERDAGVRAQLYLDTADVVMVALDAEGRIEMINRKGCDLLGFREDELLGRDWFETALPQGVRDEVGGIYRRVLEGTSEPMVYLENTVLTKGGEERLVAWHNAFLTDGDGKITGAISSGRDITVLRRVEASLRESEDRLRSLYESVQAGVILQAASGEILHANTAAEKILDLPAHEMEGRTSEDPKWQMVDEEGNRVSGADHPSMITLRTGEPIRGAVRGVFSGDPHLTRWLLMNTEPRYSEDMEEVAEVVVTFLDITELKAAQAELQAERDRAQRYLDVAEVMLIALDSRGRIEMINRKGCELLEAREEDLLGRDWFELTLSPEVLPEVRQVFDRIMRGEIEPVEFFENPMKTASGKVRHMAWHNSVLRSPSGEVRGSFSSGEDITARRKAQKALEESEAQSRALLETSPDHILLLDEDLKVQFVNRPAPGLSIEDLLGKPLHLFEAEGEGSRVENLLRGVLETGEPVTYASTLPGPDGGVIYYESRVGRVVSGDEVGLIVTARDVTARVETEDALRESEARYRELFTEMQEGMAVHEMVWDEGGNPVDYRFLEVNPAFEALTGFSREDLIGKSVLEVLPETEELWLRRYSAVVKTGIPDRFEAESAPLGRLYQVSAFRPEEGQFAATFTDVTPRVLAERELQKQQERLELAQRVGRIGLIDQEIRTGSAVWSDLTFEILGLDPDTTTPGPDALLGAVHPDDRGGVIAALDRLKGGEDLPWLECRLVHANGEIRWLRLVARVFSSSDGTPLARVLGTLQDITELKRVAEALRESEERFRSVFERSPVGIAVSNAAGEMVTVNRRFAEILGFDQEDLLGLNPADLTHPEDREETNILNRKLLSGVSSGHVMDKRYLRKDGSAVWCHLTTSAIRGPDGDVAMGLGMIQDVSEERQAQENLLRSQDRLRALAARLARIREDERTAISRELHDELGQTLTGLRMDLAMERSDLPEEMKELKERFENLIRTTDENIDLVRELSSRLRPPILDVMGLGPAIEWQVDEYRPRTSIRFHLDLPEDGPDLADEGRIALFRIVQESLTNVFRHAGASNVWVTLAESGGLVKLRVEDDGRGIHHGEGEKFRSLGLLGMEERALGIGGEFSVRPREGGGTVVRVNAPVKPVEEKGEDG